MEEHISSLSEVGGWLSVRDARLLAHIGAAQEELGTLGNILEIGVWQGKSALLLYKLLRDEELLYAADIFDLRSDDHPFFNDPRVFESNCRQFGCDDRVVPIKVDTSTDSRRLLEAVCAQPLRLAHIDGGHDYLVVKKDIDLVKAVISDDGVIVFDDFFNIRHPGTTQAIMEFLLASREFVPFLMTPKKLAVCPAHLYKNYYTYVERNELARKRVQLFHRRCFQVLGNDE